MCGHWHVLLLHLEYVDSCFDALMPDAPTCKASTWISDQSEHFYKNKMLHWAYPSFSEYRCLSLLGLVIVPADRSFNIIGWTMLIIAICRLCLWHSSFYMFTNVLTFQIEHFNVRKTVLKQKADCQSFSIIIKCFSLLSNAGSHRTHS